MPLSLGVPFSATCLAAVLAVAGCQRLPDGLHVPLLPTGDRSHAGPQRAGQPPEKSQPNAPADDPSGDRAVLAKSLEKDAAGRARSVWIRTVQPSPSDFRWHYPNLDELLARPPERRPNLRQYLADSDPIVASNVAIALARSGDGSGSQRLLAVARAPELLLPMRCAAIEALATVKDAATVDALRELTDQYGRTAAGVRSRYIAELHVELIRGLARHLDAADDPRFVDALRSPAAEVRLEALAAWAAGRRGTLPVELADLRTNGDCRVRAAALQALAKRRHPQAQEYATAALTDTDMNVRVAAIAALGDLGGSEVGDCPNFRVSENGTVPFDATRFGTVPEVEATLQGLLKKRQPDRIRTESVVSLARLGAKKPVLEAANDESWRVRIKVAEALHAWPDRDGAAAAQRLLDDPSMAVQRAVLAALAGWPLERAGPILLDAMSKEAFLTRKTASTQLAARWPPADAFPFEGPPQRRSEVLDQLHARFRREFTAASTEAAPSSGPKSSASVEAATHGTDHVTPEQVAEVERLLRQQDTQALAAFGSGLVDAFEQLVFDRQQALPATVYRYVLPRYGPAFVALDQLDSGDLLQRRRAADQLAKLAEQRPLGQLAVARLADLVATEQDQLVWRSVLTAVANDPREPSIRLAYTAIGHPSPEVRRRACEHLAAHPDPQHAKVLLPALQDSSQPVVCAAIRALGAAGRLDDTEPLRRLSGATNEQVRMETAVALVRLGDPSGIAALERMAYSNDPSTQRQAAQVMGEFPAASFTPALVRLLDGQASVCRTALESLPKVVGRDVAEGEGRPPENTSERIRRWKQWYERQATAPQLAEPR